MRALGLALVLILSLGVALPSAPALPKDAAGDVLSIETTECYGKPIGLATVAYKDDIYLIFLNPESERVMIIRFDQAGEMLDAQLGRLKNGDFVSSEVLTPAAVLKRYPSPCDFLVLGDA